MKSVRKERLNALIFAQEEINMLYHFLDDIRNTTECKETKYKVEKFLNAKLEINPILLRE